MPKSDPVISKVFTQEVLMNRKNVSKLKYAKNNYKKINKKIEPFVIRKKRSLNTTAGKWHMTEDRFITLLCMTAQA